MNITDDHPITQAEPRPYKQGDLARAVAAQVDEQRRSQELEQADNDINTDATYDSKRKIFTSGIAKRFAAAITHSQQ